MAEGRSSIVEYFSKQNKSRCGYCSSNEGYHTYGLHAHTLTVEDYQNMIDRGWRRSSQYCYKSIMDTTCCPLYTIRCEAKNFKLSKTQKKILKRFNNFLLNDTITKNIRKDVLVKTENSQPMEMCYMYDEQNKSDKTQLNVRLSRAHQSDQSGSLKNIEDNELNTETKTSESTELTKQRIILSKEESNKNKSGKAKYLRIERKRQKLQNLGFNEEEVAKKLIEKKKYPVTKTIEDYITELQGKKLVHNLKVSLVRSYPRSEEFDRTCTESFELYKRYQRLIHKEPPEKLSQNQFERFLVISPLQIQLVHVKSCEFEMTFRESASLFAKYQKKIHHETDEDCDVNAFTDFLVNSPLEASQGYGSYHQQYWLDNKLIAVGVIDILPRCVSSVYFFYDPDYGHLCLGTYGALREIAFTRKLSNRFPELIYYYTGFYIHSCIKMKYKAAFKPSFLLCPEVYTWHPVQECLPKLDLMKYSRLNEDPLAVDANSDVSTFDVLILCDGVAMPFGFYLKYNKCDPEDRKEIMEYATVIGKTCARNMLLFRKFH